MFARKKAAFSPALVVLASLLLSFGQAQTFITYYADDLERVPGVIKVSKGFNTILQFYDKVEHITVSKSEIVQIKDLDPSTWWLTTGNNSGTTGLTAFVNGRVLQFIVRVEPGSTNRTYRIEPSRPSQVASPSASSWVPSSPAPASGGVAPSLQERPSTTSSQSGSSAPSSTSRKTPPASPSQQLANFTITYAPAPPGGYQVRFTLQNVSGETVYADLGRLRFIQGGKVLTYTIDRTPARARLNPGETQTGTVFVRADPSKPVTYRWTFVTGDGRSQELSGELLPSPDK
jgi:hypothetical protein